jgi:hypothetical protein
VHLQDIPCSLCSSQDLHGWLSQIIGHLGDTLSSSGVRHHRSPGKWSVWFLQPDIKSPSQSWQPWAGVLHPCAQALLLLWCWAPWFRLPCKVKVKGGQVSYQSRFLQHLRFPWWDSIENTNLAQCESPVDFKTTVEKLFLW